MTKRTATTSSKTKKTNETAALSAPLPLVVSTGCPRGIGPEVALRGAFDLERNRRQERPIVLLGDRALLERAARLVKVPDTFVSKIGDLSGQDAPAAGVWILDPGDNLSTQKRRYGRPDELDGQAQLNYVETGFALAKKWGAPLVTGPVSKEVIAHSGLARAKKFRGHTEWLEALDGAPYSVMCFQSERLTCSLVTTHVPVSQLSRLVTPEAVERAIVELFDLVARLKPGTATIAVCSLNPHAGEGELLGSEEKRAIVPGISAAKRRIKKAANITGPLGAETAFRKAAAGAFDAVVAIYHDQATIPMKVLAFGDAVNVTQGLSIIRTSVDHGTGYDIAGTGAADARGMRAALQLAEKLADTVRQV